MLDSGLVRASNRGAATGTKRAHKNDLEPTKPQVRRMRRQDLNPNPRIKSPLLCSFILLELLSNNASTCRELSFRPVAGIRVVPIIKPPGVGPGVVQAEPGIGR